MSVRPATAAILDRMPRRATWWCLNQQHQTCIDREALLDCPSRCHDGRKPLDKP